jgi:hypothetical protein
LNAEDDVRLLPYALVIGAVLAALGSLALFALGALNLAYAVDGDAESPELNAAFGALFILAGAALLAVGVIAARFAIAWLHRQAGSR